jgi:hypothetical protein
MGRHRATSVQPNTPSITPVKNMFPSASRFFNAKALSAFAVLLTMSFFTPAYSAPVPTDEEQEILIKTTLMTFNDANLTNNYSVLYAKASKPFRAQITVEKLVDAFKVYRDKEVNLESIVAADMDPGNKSTINADGVLNMKGKFKDDDKRIGFDLKFVDENGTWKMIAINVTYKEE